jgi:voltage-gated potassium channel Kch
MARPRLLDRRMSRFLRQPVSVRNAANTIVTATAIVVGISGLAMRLLDHSEYPSIGRGIWWAMQTVTTVGYGDVTPRHVSGRIVACVVMLWGIAFVAILVAAVVSTFVARSARERELADAKGDEELALRLDDLAARLDRIERLLSR